MRQVIRTYAVVALVLMTLLLLVWFIGGLRHLGELWIFVAIFQLWLWPLIPLGVLSACDAARVGRRGWSILLIALTVLSPFAINAASVVGSIVLAVTPPCAPADCSLNTPSPVDTPIFVAGDIGWIVGILAIPLAALIYSLVIANNNAPVSLAVERGERRILIIGAIVCIIVMVPLTSLATTGILPDWAGAQVDLPLEEWGTLMSQMSNLQYILDAFWLALVALPAIVASVALAHAIQTRRIVWQIGWAALIALTLFTESIANSETIYYILEGGLRLDEWPVLWPTRLFHFVEQALHVTGVVIPALVMVVALIYAYMVMHPSQPRAAAASVVA
jgi:hypothetical protein